MFYVTYLNEGKLCKTQLFETLEQAQKSVEFLKIQGAKSIKIHRG